MVYLNVFTITCRNIPLDVYNRDVYHNSFYVTVFDVELYRYPILRMYSVEYLVSIYKVY